MLLKVIHTSFEEGLDFFSWDVLGYVCATAFCVAHFSEDSAAGAGDSFDGVDGAVWIELGVHGGFAVEVGVLGGNLAGFG